MELNDKHCEGISYFNLASVCCNDSDYEVARYWYEKALDISVTEPIDRPLHSKVLTAFGIALFNLGDTEKAIESIQEAQSFAEKKLDTGTRDCNIVVSKSGAAKREGV